MLHGHVIPADLSITHHVISRTWWLSLTGGVVQGRMLCNRLRKTQPGARHGSLSALRTLQLSGTRQLNSNSRTAARLHGSPMHAQRQIIHQACSILVIDLHQLCCMSSQGDLCELLICKTADATIAEAQAGKRSRKQRANRKDAASQGSVQAALNVRRSCGREAAGTAPAAHDENSPPAQTQRVSAAKPPRGDLCPWRC